MEIQQTGIKRFIKKYEDVLPLCKFVVEVVIAVVGVFVACSANQISKAQKEIEEKAALPIIDLESVYDEEGNVREVSIVNTGGSLSDLSVEIFPFALLCEGQKAWAIPLYKMYTSPDNEPTKGTKENCFPLQYLQYKPHTNYGALLKISDRSPDLLQFFSIINELEYSPRNNVGNLYIDYYLSLRYKNLINSEFITEEYYIHSGHSWKPIVKNFFLPVGISRIKQNTWEETVLNKLKEERASETKEYVTRNIIYADSDFDKEHLVDVLTSWKDNEDFIIPDFPQEYLRW